MATEIDIAKDGDISYRLLSKDRLEEGAILLSHAFLNGEPIVSCIKQPYEAELASNKSVCHAVVDDGVSLVAIDNSCGKVVGITTAGLATAGEILKEARGDEDVMPVMAPPATLPYYKPIVAIIKELDQILMDDSDFVNNPDAKVCSSAKLGVDVNYRGRGIASKLIELRTQIAREKDCKFIIAQASAPGSQKLYSKLGFEEVGEIKYKDFEYKGEKVYSSVTMCPSAKMVILKL
ncbi:arylalkylamine N-acetyltransferase 1-like [Glandiceps talaboti]